MVEEGPADVDESSQEQLTPEDESTETVERFVEPTPEQRALRRGELRRRRRRADRRVEEYAAESVSDLPDDRLAGISVIIPSYRGRELLGACLESLVAQTLDPGLLEVIVVLNGEPDGSRGIYERIATDHAHLTWRLVELLDRPSVGRARNAGIAIANRRHVAFIDDDDTVSPNYLAALYAHAGSDIVPMAWLDDVSLDGEVDPLTPVNRVLADVAGRTIDATDAPSLLSLNACKLLPLALVQRVGYDPDLRSGVDVEFLTKLYAAGRFRLHALRRDEGAVYRRSVRPGSVSRQAYDFAFSVEGRLEVMQRIARHTVSPHRDVRLVARSMSGAQAGFMRRYLADAPGERARVIEAVRQRDLPWFAWPVLNRDQARRLAVSFCFVPYAGTSSIVAAKRILQAKELVDVIYNAMDDVRDIDETTRAIAQPFIDREVVIPSPTLFGSWRAVREFCALGWTAIEEAEAVKGPYTSVWSRAMWPASHALAALHRLRRPDAPWVAEFSDPLSRNVQGERRSARIGDDEIAAELLAGLAAEDVQVPADTTMFELCELLAYALASELHFTNTNQLEFMLSYCPPALRSKVRDKARLMPQPTLPPAFYELADVDDHDLSPECVNIGYFGAFYANRGIGEVLDAIESLDPAEQSQVRLHVFTGDPAALASAVAERPAAARLRIAGYRPYLEFLALARRMDALLVNDAATAGSAHDVNPYLPSKYSDYRGAGAPVWGHLESGSPLSHERLAYVSQVGDVDSVRDVLRALVAALPSARRTG